MKKILLMLALAIAGMTIAQAQLIQRNPDTNPIVPRAAKAPAMKALGPNQLYMGPYTSDAIADYGLGLASYPGVTKMGIVLPLDMVQPFVGGQMKAIRVGLCAAIDSGKVFVYPVTKLSPLTLGEPIVEVKMERTQAGWNTVNIPEPITISDEGIAGLMLGYQYLQIAGSTSPCYPVSVVEEGTILDSYTNCAVTGNKWQDIGLSDYGNLSIQAIVENENFPAYNLVMTNLASTAFAKISDGLRFQVSLANVGIKTLENYTIDMLVDGQLMSTIDSPAELTPDAQTFTGICPLDGLDMGSHTFTLKVGTVAGEAVEEPAELSTEFKAYTESFPRQKQLVEQFTAQGCTHCPKGVFVLETLKEMRGGDMEWVAIHNNFNGTDVFTISAGTSLASYLGCTAFPTGAFNRFDAENTGELPQSLGYYPQYAQMAAEMFNELYFEGNPTPSMFSIDLTAAYDTTTRALNVKVAGNAAEGYDQIIGSNLGLTVYLTEDSLVARQLSDGTWITNYTHNHVLRSVLSNYQGDAFTVTDGTYAKEYTTTLSDAWNPKNMRVIAFISLKGAGTAKEVINCEGIAIPIPEPGGVYGDVDGNGIVDITDMNIIINVILGLEENPAADVDGNGITDITDMNIVINAILGIEK